MGHLIISFLGNTPYCGNRDKPFIYFSSVININYMNRKEQYNCHRYHKPDTQINGSLPANIRARMHVDGLSMTHAYDKSFEHVNK